MNQMNYEYCNGFTHTIKKGDTLYEISRKHNVPLALLLRANPYVDVFNLQVGDTICIPSENNQAVPYPVNIMPRSEVWGERQMELRENTSDEEESGMRMDNRSFQTTPNLQNDQNSRNNQSLQNDQNSRNNQNIQNDQNSRNNQNIQNDQNAQINRSLQSDRNAQINRSLRNDRNIGNGNNTEEFVWAKYVVQPGDTMADIVGEMDGTIEDFIERNGLSSIYMLPGVAYYIQKERD